MKEGFGVVEEYFVDFNYDDEIGMMVVYDYFVEEFCVVY